jgi:hypothetical protein
MKKPEFKGGMEARKNFEETMQKLFRAPKPPKTAKPTAKVPVKESGK